MTTTTSIPLTVIKPPATSKQALSHQQIERDLTALIEGEVRFGRHDRMLYATDASIYQVEPIGVVCPRTINDVEAVVKYCAEHSLPILPRGGGTSLAGQTVNNAIVIDFSQHCRGLLEVDVHRRLARVEPGIVLDHLNASLAVHSLKFGPDVATSGHANLGGMIGNNSAGAHSILYGRTVEHLIGLDVMLANGVKLRLDEGAAMRDPRVHDLTQRIANVILPREMEIERRFPKIVRHVDGYNLDLILKQLRDSTPGTFDRVNLAHLVCGSEGTLAITLQATLNLVQVPECTGLAIIGFTGVDEALRSLMPILDTKPAAVELIDDVVIGLARKNVEYSKYVELLPTPPSGAAGAVLYVAYFADDFDALSQQFDELQLRFPSQSINRYTDAAATAQAWKLRKAGEPLLHGLHGARKPITFIEDTAVNPDRLADFVTDFRAMVADHGTTAAYYAHASVGCLHIRPMVSLRDPSDLKVIRAIAEQATDLVIRYGGALSGEHGDGRVRSHLLERFYGREVCEAFRAIKAIFDPENRLNPGNIVAPTPESMLEHLRVRPQQCYVDVPSAQTYFRYEKEHGLLEAVEMCNGAGVCRKMKGGTMCPSYRATLDERHATRGRGNALRLAITGQFSTNGRTSPWIDAETKKTLDLCLSCKACKSECPSNVDIAKLKAEYTAQGYAETGRIPIAAKMFGRIRFINRLGSAMHPFANALGAFAPIKMIADRILRLHPSRALPRFSQSLHKWKAKHDQIGGGHSHILENVRMSAQHDLAGHGNRNLARASDRPTVVLFPDCFTVYNEAHIGRAAILTLEKLGYRVVLPQLGCCGRSLISTGMLAEAASAIQATALALMDSIKQENAIAIVGCEPSCISAIKDEWLELELGIDQLPLRELAAKSFLVEEFIESRWNEHPSKPNVTAPKRHRRALLHGHCHQKALWGVETSSKILRRLLGEQLQVIDSGCCGMAGSFGYTRDHYDISIKIGERSLFPPIRESDDDAIVLAPGTSCRQQIHDGAGRSAVHPIELIAELLDANASEVAAKGDAERK